jgi:hypothetical protein
MTSEQPGTAPHKLPDDVENPMFSEGLRLLRSSYRDRTSFNHFVCDELARRGIAPNSANVLQYGRWGQSVAVAADVRAWFAQLSRRLSERHANIPDVCQRQFNALGEQFWALALEQVGKPLREELLRTQEAAAREAESAAARQAALATASDLAEKRFQAQIAELEEQIGALEHQLQQSRGAADQARTELRSTRDRAAAAELALESARKDYESRQRALEAAAEADKKAREHAHAETVAMLNAANERLQTQHDLARKESAAQVDKARLDARAAEDRARQEQLRADTARSETEIVREHLSNERIAHARTQRDLEALQGQHAKAQREIDEARSALTAALESAKLAAEEVLLDLAQSAAEAGIELRVPPGARRPSAIDERTWKVFSALANAQNPAPKPGKATKG